MNKIKNNPEDLNVLGIKIPILSRAEILEKISRFLADDKPHYVVTPNPEIILKAGEDEELFHILNQADLAIPDGAGLKIAAWFSGKNIKRVTGADLTRELLALAEKENRKVAVVGRNDSLSKKEEIEKAISGIYPRLEFKVVFVNKESMKLPEEIKNFKPEILFSNFGAPYQEKFVFHSSKEKDSPVRIAIGVGGSFDFLTGRLKRAPLVLRFFGFEWFWRFLLEPKRWKRIFNAIIVFPCKVFKQRAINPFFYRPNVSCLLFKRENVKFKILIVEKASEPGHWQLPQGGKDWESAEEAGKRELAEEIGTDSFRPVAAFQKVYRYQFPAGQHNRFARHNSFKGQKQDLFIAEFTGRDEEIGINYWDHSAWKWAPIEKLTESLHPVRRKAAEIFLKKFYQVIK